MSHCGIKLIMQASEHSSVTGMVIGAVIDISAYSN
jgi:hypothetical protein